MGWRRREDAGRCDYDVREALMRSWEEINKQHRLTLIEGWMEEDELQWLYETALSMAGKTVVEVGSFMGRSTCAILAGLKQAGGARLFAVDSFDGRATPRESEAVERGLGWLHRQFMENIKVRGFQIPEILPMESAEAARRFRPVSIDWVFIDAGHSYESVTNDLKSWAPLVRQGGVVSGHDYQPNWAGVVLAIDTFFAPLKVSKGSRSIWKLVKTI